MRNERRCCEKGAGRDIALKYDEVVAVKFERITDT